MEYSFLNSRPERHHALWEKRQYKSPLEKQVRQMSAFILDVPHFNHRLLHASMRPPEKPEPDTLRRMRELAPQGLLVVLNKIDHPIVEHIENQLEIININPVEAMTRIEEGDYSRA